MREPKLGVAVGKKGIGKSYTTERVLAEYVKGMPTAKPRRVLILDVNDDIDIKNHLTNLILLFVSLCE